MSRFQSTRSETTSAAPSTPPVTLVEYGDFECRYCGQAEPVIRELLRDSGDVRYVWRHLPLSDVHPHARLAAEASEAAAAQGAFWQCTISSSPTKARSPRAI
jgi:protein-disulfide isomerase